MKNSRLDLGLAIAALAIGASSLCANADDRTASVALNLNDTQVGNGQEFRFAFDLPALPPMASVRSATLTLGAWNVDGRLYDPILCFSREVVGYLGVGDGLTVVSLPPSLGGTPPFAYLQAPELPFWVIARELDTVMVQGEWWEEIRCQVWIPQTCYYPQPRYCDRYICDFWLFGTCMSGHWERYQCGVDYIPYDCGFWTTQICDRRYHPPIYEDRDGVLVMSFARLDIVYSPPDCPSDMNQDGGIDGADVEAFFVVWEAGERSADLNADGGVDGSDVTCFFEHWESGC